MGRAGYSDVGELLEVRRVAEARSVAVDILPSRGVRSSGRSVQDKEVHVAGVEWRFDSRIMVTCGRDMGEVQR